MHTPEQAKDLWCPMARTVLACANVPESIQDLARQLTAPRESASTTDEDEADMAYHRLKTSGRLFQQEVDRAHAIEVQMGLH